MTEPGRDRHIEYAQARRDNETEAREELASRLPDLSPAFRRRGDLTQAAKVMVAALQYFAPDTEVGNPVSRRDFGGSRSKEYAKLRRDNEAEAREALSGVIPERFHEDPDLERNDFNRTTKVVIAAAKYFDELSRRGGKDSVATGSEEVSEEVEGSCLEGSSSTLVVSGWSADIALQCGITSCSPFFRLGPSDHHDTDSFASDSRSNSCEYITSICA